jgi:glutamate-1-semialdehyde aminotransferase/acyl carrier protein
MPRKDRLIGQLVEILEDSSGLELEGASPDSTFLELGLDSLFLTQLAMTLQTKFGVKLSFRQLLEDLPTVAAVAEHLDGALPPEAAPAQEAAMKTQAPPAPSGVAGSAPPQTELPALPPLSIANGAPPAHVQQVIDQQLRLMARQLEILGGRRGASPAVAAPAPAPKPAEAEAPAPVSQPYDPSKAFGAIARIHVKQTAELSPKQRARLDAFIRRYNARTAKSKGHSQENRAVLSDPRVVSGFKPAIKELVYPIVVNRSHGSKMWDLDGNEYVDVLSGFGSNFFGYQPSFVTDALKKQIDLGYEVGPQTPLAAEAAHLVCELTGHDRAAFCNTGSEAVMGAMRIARTVTGRRLIAFFTGSYHGIFDEVIVRGTKKLKSFPAAPGIMPSTVENALVLDYGTPESMEILKARANELAAILIEPIQSRRPDWQPKEFVQQCRELTQASGSALIFDEVITGFRLHLGGAQAYWGIRADIATYGKVLGGGMSIGVIAGKRDWMDALDGGHWQFGDASAPTVGVTYFAGTFVRHPLAMAACKASLEFLKAKGPRLQEALNEKTAQLAQELNAHFDEVGAPLHIKHFGSLWKTFFTTEQPLGELLFCYLRDKGIHIWDGFPCFLTIAHSDADVARIVQAFKESVAEMQEAGFLPERKAPAASVFDASAPPVPGARLGRDPSGNPAWYVPHPKEPGKYVKMELPS